MMIPWTGLGNYNGFRGNTWLKNRIQIFKQFVLPSLLAQTNQNFTVWCCWRREERNNPLVKDYVEFMETTGLEVVHTFAGVPMFDDKYSDEVGRLRLINTIHDSMGTLLDSIADCKYVLLTIQPSDDCYHKLAVQNVQLAFQQTDHIAVGFSKGYIANYLTKEVAEYNPLTNPPFYTIKFPRETFIDPLKHYNYTALKHDVGKYKKGLALPSHEYVADCFKYGIMDVRGFLVGTHGANISTNFNIPYKGQAVDTEVLREFGIYDVPKLKIHVGLKKKLLLKLPYKVQRKLRYWFSEKLRI